MLGNRESRANWQLPSVKPQPRGCRFNFSVPAVSVSAVPQSSGVPTVAQTVQTFKWHWQSLSRRANPGNRYWLFCLYTETYFIHIHIQFVWVFFSFFFYIYYFSLDTKRQRIKKKNKKKGPKGKNVNGRLRRKKKNLFWNIKLFRVKSNFLTCLVLSFSFHFAPKAAYYFSEEQRSVMPGWIRRGQRGGRTIIYKTIICFMNKCDSGNIQGDSSIHLMSSNH